MRTPSSFKSGNCTTFAGMVSLHLKFMGNGKECSADIELEGISGSWDAEVQVEGHPSIHEFHIKFWLGDFMMPVFENRDDAIFFEPLFTLIEEEAKKILPAEFV